MNKLFSTLVLGACALALNTAGAHTGDKPKHGGIVQGASELSFELVPQADGVTLYVEDHGKPLATEGMSGRLTVLQGARRSEADLKAAGDNRLEARGVKLARGAKAVAALSMGASKAVTVRFTVK